MSIYYVDTSALAKLVIDEAESVAFNRWLHELRDARMVTSALTVTELHRAARRVDEDASAQADRALASVRLRRITPAILSDAAKLIQSRRCTARGRPVARNGTARGAS